MPEPIVDIRLVGSDVLTQLLGSFPPVVQKKVVRSALRKSTKRTKDRVVNTWRQHADRGITAAAMAAVKVRAGKRSRRGIRFEWPLPTREALGIAANDPYYYPHAVEYGHPRAPAKAYTRHTVDLYYEQEMRAIGHDIGDGVEREAARHFRKAMGIVK